MPAASLNVRLLAATPNALELIYAAFRQCYHAGYVGDMWDGLMAGETPREKQTAFVERILASGIRGLVSELKGLGPGPVDNRID